MVRIMLSGVLNSWAASAVNRLHFLERTLKPLDHVVERPGEPAQLIVGVCGVEPTVEPTGA